MRWRLWRRRLSQPSSKESSSIWSWIGGKRVLNDSLYVLPADTAEEERLNLQHHFYKLTLGGNHRSPVRQPRQILDVACGTGIWGREIAQEFSQAQVIGFDINPEPFEQAQRIAGTHWPPNFQFLQANALERFPFEERQFTFTHAQLMSTWLPIAQYPLVVAEMLRVTRPGGYVELVDFEVPTTASVAATILMQSAGTLLTSRGLHNGGGPHIAGYLRQAGLIRVQERRIVSGTGRNRLREQRLLVADLLAALRGMGPILVKAGMLSASEHQQLIEQAQTELPRVGAHCAITAAYGMRSLKEQ